MARSLTWHFDVARSESRSNRSCSVMSGSRLSVAVRDFCACEQKRVHAQLPDYVSSFANATSCLVFMKKLSALLALLVAISALLLAGCSDDSEEPSGSDPVSTSCSGTALMCGGQCVDTQSNSLHCGACNNACSTGGTCLAGSCQCQAGLQQCGGQCVDLSSDSSNCGQCGNNCAASGQFCSSGQCSATCAAGQVQCGSSCVDTASSVLHCGACNNACAAGSACTAGACSCPAGQTQCADGSCADQCPTAPVTPNPAMPTGGAPATGGPSSGGASAGGQGNVPSEPTGGAGGGANPGNPAPGNDNPGAPAAALNCTDPVYGAVTIEPGQVISDFATGQPVILVQEGRGDGAEPWHAYAAGDMNDPTTNQVAVPSESNPKHASNTFAVDANTSGPCNQGGALRVTTPGNFEWGMGFGIDFMARDAQFKKLTYDASAYTGIGFWAKATKDVPFAYFKVVDGHEDADVAAGEVPQVCSYADENRLCNQYGIKNTTITKDWTYYKLYFDELLQDPAGSRWTGGVDPSKLTAFQIHVNPRTNRVGNKQLNDFDLYIDDVHFLTEPMPALPNDTVTYTTSGNQILRNGLEHRIRGLVRPSMEWDYAGFGISREDIQRMKAWGPNAIRLAVMDTFWADPIYGGIYQAHVKRAVGWILQEGMDAILDLHYVSGLPDAENAAFWNAIAADPFFANNGRIIFELYNEPTGNFDTLQRWMQSTTTSIRNRANNLILVGGVNYSYDISGYLGNAVTGGAVAYVTHPYVFKEKEKSAEDAYLSMARMYPVVATEFGDANIEDHPVGPDQCEPQHNANGIQNFEANNISWTAWAWIVDSWGCGFPQIIEDYSGEPNAIGVPVRDALQSLAN